MKRIAFAVRSLAPAGVLALLLLAVSCASGSPAKPGAVAEASCCDAHWGYGKSDGPHLWAQLSPCYTACADGGEQSPIDLTGSVFAELPKLGFRYGLNVTVAVVNNGHTIKAQVPRGSILAIGENGFELQEFHFHTLSEHRVDGRQHPLELHLVNKGEGGRTAAVGVFIVQDPENRENPELAKIWRRLEEYNQNPIDVAGIDIMALLPKRYASYRYAGSLTTPACGQGLQWNVLAEPITASREQIERFEKLFAPTGNSRPPQPLNGRALLRDFP